MSLTSRICAPLIDLNSVSARSFPAVSCFNDARPSAKVPPAFVSYSLRSAVVFPVVIVIVGVFHLPCLTRPSEIFFGIFPIRVLLIPPLGHTGTSFRIFFSLSLPAMTTSDSGSGGKKKSKLPGQVEPVLQALGWSAKEMEGLVKSCSLTSDGRFHFFLTLPQESFDDALTDWEPPPGSIVSS